MASSHSEPARHAAADASEAEASAAEAARYGRGLLCDTLADLTEEQWAAETLCAGWDAGDIAAHLMIRERHPLTAAAGFLGSTRDGAGSGTTQTPAEPGTPAAGRPDPVGAVRRSLDTSLAHLQRTADHRQRRLAQGPRTQLVDRLRQGPPAPLLLGPGADAAIVEDWIHHHDIRLGGANLGRLEPTGRINRALWTAIPPVARVILGRVNHAGVVRLTTGEHSHAFRIARGGRVTRRIDGPVAGDAVVRATPTELILWVTGRPVEVAIDGDPALAEALRQADRSV